MTNSIHQQKVEATLRPQGNKMNEVTKPINLSFDLQHPRSRQAGQRSANSGPRSWGPIGRQRPPSLGRIDQKVEAHRTTPQPVGRPGRSSE